jgi:hypothetical protein
MMTLKTRLALIFQPYFILVFCGLFAMYGYYTYAENKLLIIIGLSITLGNAFIYIMLLRSHAIVVRSAGSMIIMAGMSLMVGIGEGNYMFGTTSGLTVATVFAVLMFIEAESINKILNDSGFVRNFKADPEMTIYKKDYGYMFGKKIKFSEQNYTYINNEIHFDHKGVKGSQISYADIQKYLDESLVSIQDFNQDSLKTIEMLRI